ncbi:hypothetical protein KI387_007417, partial [Taxus chinensis]
MLPPVQPYNIRHSLTAFACFICFLLSLVACFAFPNDLQQPFPGPTRELKSADLIQKEMDKESAQVPIGMKPSIIE